MITMKELLSGNNLTSLPAMHQNNLQVLLERMNKVRAAYGKPMTVTSGYRSEVHHLEIYKKLAAQRGVAFDQSKVPMKSCHLRGAACDISDPDGSLMKWVEANVPLMEQVGLWMEVADDQPRVHFQISPPASGARFFKP